MSLDNQMGRDALRQSTQESTITPGSPSLNVMGQLRADIEKVRTERKVLLAEQEMLKERFSKLDSERIRILAEIELYINQ